MIFQFLLFFSLAFFSCFLCTAQSSLPSDSVKPLKFALIEKVDVDTLTGFREGDYNCFFANHQLVEGYYKNDAKSGYWEYFDYSGALRIKGFYSNNMQHGEWKYYYRNGVPACALNYSNDEKNGAATGYYKNGVKSQEGFYVSDKKDSIWIMYYDDGNIMEKVFFKYGSADSLLAYYRTGELERRVLYTGEDIQRSTCYYKNGSAFYDIIFRDGLAFNLLIARDENGKPLETGDFSEGNGTLYKYYSPYNDEGKIEITLHSKATYQNGTANGQAEIFNRKGELVESGNYQNGVKTGEWIEQGNSGEQTNRTYKQPANDSIIKQPVDLEPHRTFGENTEEQPEFPGGETQLLQKYLASTPYPRIAQENDIEGTVYVKFVIDQIGYVTDIAILRGADLILNKAAMEHVKKMPLWSPGLQGGFPVKVQYIVPITFRLL